MQPYYVTFGNDRPIMSVNSVWHPRFKKDIDQIETVQRRATKLVSCLRDMPYQKRQQAMDLPSLVYRRYHGNMIEVYKFIHGIYKSGQSLLPMASSTALRGHMFKLKKRHCHTQLRSSFFSFGVVNLWNCLPSNVVSAPSVNAFKERLDKHWKDYCFTLDLEDFSRRHW